MGYYQKVQFAQLALSLSFVMLAFAAGLYAGWRRWGRSPRPVERTAPTRPRESAPARPATVATLSRRPDLFSPELDLTEPDLPLIRGELTAGS